MVNHCEDCEYIMIKEQVIENLKKIYHKKENKQ